LRHLLAPGDIECTVLSNADGVLRDELEQWGARVHVVGPVARTGADYEQRMLELALVSNLTSANVAIANTAGSFWMVDLAERLRLPNLWALHESFRLDRFVVEGLGGVDDHVHDRFVGAFASAAAVIFEADATAQLFDHLIPAGRSRRIDYGIDVARIEAFRAEHDRAASRHAKGYTDDDVILLCLGTFEPRKAQGALCAAFARVADRFPEASLALVGDTGTPYSRALHEIVDRLGLSDRVSLVPVTPDIDDWYHIADGFVLASDVESLPRSMLEVMAFEVPVLGAAVFGVPELVTDGVHGMLFEPRCLASLTAVLDRFLTLGTSQRQELGRRARERVIPGRDSRGYAAEYRALIDGLLEGSD
jgi:glycosyltransferase involved in cell wall biosynthesis